MKMLVIVCLALGITAGAAAPVAAQKRGRGDPAARYGWLTGLEEGKAQARKTGQPLMVVLRCVP